MALLKAEAERLSQNEFLSGVIETIHTEDPVYNLIDFKQINGKAYIYNREKALPTTDFKAPGDTIAESTGTTEEVISRIRGIIGDADVDNFLDETMSDSNDQTAIQIAMKVKATSRKFRDKFINGSAYSAVVASGNPTGFVTAIAETSDGCGDGTALVELDVSATSLRFTAPGDYAGDWVDFTTVDGTYLLKSGSPGRYVRVTVDASELGVADASIYLTITASKEFTGVSNLVVPAQTIYGGTNGGALSWALLDELSDLVTGTKIDVYLMNKRTIRAYKALLRAAGGTDSAMMQLDNFGKPVLTLDGIPVLENEFISTTETRGSSSTCTSVYALSLDPMAGLQGLYGGNEVGIRVKEIGELEEEDATRYRVKWYCGLALKDERAVARLAGITN